jgi:hypothetical protein
MKKLNECPLSESGCKPEPDGGQTVGHDAENYLGSKKILIGKEGGISAPSLELGGCVEEICGEAAELSRNFS